MANEPPARYNVAYNPFSPGAIEPMPVVVLLIVLAVIVFLLAKSLQDAKRQQESGAMPTKARAPSPLAATRPQRQRPRRRRPALDEESLAAHVAKLREAVRTGLVSPEDAVASIVRQTDGVVGPDAARKLLQDDAA